MKNSEWPGDGLPQTLESLQARLANLEASHRHLQQKAQAAAELLEAEKAVRQRAEGRAARLERLQAVTATLTAPLEPVQVAQVVVEQGIAALEAKGGLVALLDESGQFLEVTSAFGYPAPALEQWRRFSMDLASPLTDAIRTREVVVIERGQDSFNRYPHLQASFIADCYVAVPLEVEGRSFGVLGLTFNPVHRFDQEDHSFLLALARQCAQALERARLGEAARSARRQTEINQSRLAFLAEASEILNSSLDYQTTLTNLAQLVVPRYADWCSVDMVGEDGKLERLAVAHIDPAKVEWAYELQRRYPPEPDGSSGLAKTIRTGQSEIYPVITDALLVATAKDEEQLAILRQVGFNSAMIVPLVARGRGLGAITFVWAESGFFYDKDELSFAEDLSHRAALAVENSRLYREAQETVLVQKELDYLKNLFLSTATHELRNPLTSVKGYSQLLQRALKRLQDAPTLPDPETFRKDLDRNVRNTEMILWQVERMNRLVGELLDFSRLHNDKFELDLTNRANLSALVNRVVEQFANAGDSPPINVTLPADPVLGYWDEARLEQVLVNLITNAIKYSPENSPVTLGLSIEPSSNEVVVWVRDNGIGIDEEHQANIFDRFYRVRSGKTSSVDGLGLGLYISHEIVTRHKGRMWLESRPGSGSTFYFALPLG